MQAYLFITVFAIILTFVLASSGSQNGQISDSRSSVLSYKTNDWWPYRGHGGRSFEGRYRFRVQPSLRGLRNRFRKQRFAVKRAPYHRVVGNRVVGNSRRNLPNQNNNGQASTEVPNMPIGQKIPIRIATTSTLPPFNSTPFQPLTPQSVGVTAIVPSNYTFEACTYEELVKKVVNPKLNIGPHNQNLTKPVPFLSFNGIDSLTCQIDCLTPVLTSTTSKPTPAFYDCAYRYYTYGIAKKYSCIQPKAAGTKFALMIYNICLGINRCKQQISFPTIPQELEIMERSFVGNGNTLINGISATIVGFVDAVANGIETGAELVANGIETGAEETENVIETGAEEVSNAVTTGEEVAQDLKSGNVGKTFADVFHGVSEGETIFSEGETIFSEGETIFSEGETIFSEGVSNAVSIYDNGVEKDMNIISKETNAISQDINVISKGISDVASATEDLFDDIDQEFSQFRW